MSLKRKRDEYPLRNRKGKGSKWGSLSIDILSVIAKFLRPVEYRAVLLTCQQWGHVGKKQLIPGFYEHYFGEANNMTPDEMKKRFHYRRNIIQQKKSMLVYDAITQPYGSWHDTKISVVMDDEKVFLYKPESVYFKLIHDEKVKNFPLENSNNYFRNFHFNRDYMAGCGWMSLKIWNNDGRLIWGHDCKRNSPGGEELLKIWGSDVCYDDNEKIKVCDIRSGVRREIGDLGEATKILFENNMIYTNGNGYLKIYDLRKPENVFKISFINGNYDFGLFHERLYMPYGHCVMEFDKRHFMDPGKGKNYEHSGYDINKQLLLEDCIYEKITSYDDMFICHLYKKPWKLHFVDLRRGRVYHKMKIPRFDSVACSNGRVAYSYGVERGGWHYRIVEILDFS